MRKQLKSLLHSLKTRQGKDAADATEYILSLLKDFQGQAVVEEESLALQHLVRVRAVLDAQQQRQKEDLDVLMDKHLEELLRACVGESSQPPSYQKGAPPQPPQFIHVKEYRANDIHWIREDRYLKLDPSMKRYIVGDGTQKPQHSKHDIRLRMITFIHYEEFGNDRQLLRLIEAPEKSSKPRVIELLLSGLERSKGRDLVELLKGQGNLEFGWYEKLSSDRIYGDLINPKIYNL